jgi:hypothetical protein
MLRERLLKRDETFLKLVEDVIFQNPANPYAVMFRLAGCSHGDLAAAIRRNGLNATLDRLRREGVYLTHEEFKGRQRIVRGGREIPGTTDSFLNPYVRGILETSSSGSSGQPVRSPRSLESRIHGWTYQMAHAKEFGWGGGEMILLRPILPYHIGLMLAIHARRLGTPMDRWFSEGSGLPTFSQYQWLTRGMLLWANLMGAQAVFPEFLPPNDFLPVARHVARRRAEGRRCFVQGSASHLVRVADAALQQGLDISGTTFLSGGEALTPGKIGVFERARARAYAHYAIGELGRVGVSCRHCVGNRVHLLEDSVAVIPCRRASPYDEAVEVNSLFFTSLAAHAARVLINVEMDDEGELLPAACDCVFSRIGYKTLITNINSFGKVSPQGMTFHAAELQRLLEEQMPARLGGGPGDYQLVEFEAGSAQTQLRLYVSPRTGLTDKARAASVFMELMRPRWGGALATRAWDHSGGIDVVVAEPYVTRSGKVHAVRLLHSTSVQPCEARGAGSA